METFEIPHYTLKISQISDKLFGLSEQEKGILFCIAKNGPVILADIEKVTSNYSQWETDHWEAKRRIDGTGDFIGLIRCEYLMEKKHEKRIRGKEGKVYCLNTKGVLAALSTGLTLNKIYLIKNFFNFLDFQLSRPIKLIGSWEKGIETELNFSLRKELLEIFKNFITFRIYTFLIWNEATGYSLQLQQSSQWHMYDFVQNTTEYVHSKFPIINDKIKLELYRWILRNNFIYSKLLHALDKICTSNNPRFTIKNNAFAQTLKLHIAKVAEHVWYWPYYIEKYQNYNDDTYTENKNFNPDFISKPETGINIELIGEPGKKKLIKPALQTILYDNLNLLGLEKNDAEKVLQNVWTEEHESFEMLKFGRIPN